MGGGVAEGDLQGLVEVMECGGGGTGESAGYWGVGDGGGAELESESVIRAFAVGFVGRPVVVWHSAPWDTWLGRQTREEREFVPQYVSFLHRAQSRSLIESDACRLQAAQLGGSSAILPSHMTCFL